MFGLKTTFGVIFTKGVIFTAELELFVSICIFIVIIFCYLLKGEEGYPVVRIENEYVMS